MDRLPPFSSTIAVDPAFRHEKVCIMDRLPPFSSTIAVDPAFRHEKVLLIGVSFGFRKPTRISSL
jgi:hypothetical protein